VTGTAGRASLLLRGARLVPHRLRSAGRPARLPPRGRGSYACDVYLNGRRLARHEGAYTAFDVELTGHLQDGENVLILKVDNSLTGDTVPTRKTDWSTMAG
jgi:hypothetical protein